MPRRWKLWLTLAIIGFFLTLFVWKGGAYAYLTARHKVVTIESFVVKGDTCDQKYLIFASEDSVFENTNSEWWLKYDSPELFGRLEKHKGKLVRLFIYGIREPYVLRWYPNIISFKPVQ